MFFFKYWSSNQPRHWRTAGSSVGLNSHFARISLVGNYDSFPPLCFCHRAEQVPLSFQLQTCLSPVLTLSLHLSTSAVSAGPPHRAVFCIASKLHPVSLNVWIQKGLCQSQHGCSFRNNAIQKNSMVTHACDPSIPNAKAKWWLQVQSQPVLHSQSRSAWVKEWDFVS